MGNYLEATKTLLLSLDLLLVAYPTESRMKK